MSKKTKKEKVSSSSKKEKEEIDMSEYEEDFDGEYEAETTEKVDYDEYELPDDFVAPEDRESDEDLNWFQRRRKQFEEMDNYQRLYWIKILSGVVAGMIIGLAGAQTGWWLFLLVGLYAVITAGGFFLFKLEWNWKEILFSGFFPYVALFWMFWTLMFTSLYAPPFSEWFNLLIITSTVNETTTTYLTTFTQTTSAAGFPLLTIIFTVVAALGLIQFLLRRRRNLD